MADKSVYEQLTDRILLSGSTIIPRLFEMIADEDEARLMLAMPGLPAELVEQSGLAIEEVTAALDRLYHKGLVFPSRSGKYRMCRDIAQFHDATILWPEAPRAYLDLWQEFMETEWPGFAKMIEGFLPNPFTRVVPVEQSIEATSQILSHEAMEEIIASANRLAVTKCTCRLTAGKCDAPMEVCLQIDRGADYAIDRGTGREIGRDEALRIIRDCEEAGLIHVAVNTSRSSHFICNCCRCCCQTMPILIKEGIRLTAPSRFEAYVEEETCIGCGTCGERCFFGAISLGEGEDARAAVVGKLCLGCGLCQVSCPSGAVVLREVRPREFIPG